MFYCIIYTNANGFIINVFMDSDEMLFLTNYDSFKVRHDE